MNEQKKTSASPFAAMRYVIMQNEEGYAFYFGNGETDHAMLETIFKDENGSSWNAVCGGFYTLKRNDLNPKREQGIIVKTLILFDLSTSFGMHDDVLNEALPGLITNLKKQSIEVKHEYYS